MELKPGYKQTEIGIVPETWEVVELGKLFSFKNGLNKAKQFFGYGTPIVNYMDVYTKRGLRMKDIAGRVSLSSQEIDNYRVMIGDVLFTRTSETSEEVGISSVVLDELEDTVFSGFVLRARPITTKLQPLFAQYCFSPTHVRKQVISKSTYTTRALTNGKSLSSVVIAIPSTNNEQSNIANSISDIDILITSLEKLIEKKKLIKQGVMQELLTGKRRLPGFRGEWETKRLGDIAEIYSGGTPSTSTAQYWDGDINWFTPTEIGYEKYVHKSDRTISDQGLSKSSAKLLPAGTIVLTTRASIGDVSILNCEGCTNQGCQSLVMYAHFDNEFLYYKLLTLKNVMMQYASGSTFFELSPSKLKEILTSIPEYQEQKRIAEVLSEIDRDLKVMNEHRDKLNLLKQAMMQELLTGRIRLT